MLSSESLAVVPDRLYSLFALHTEIYKFCGVDIVSVSRNHMQTNSFKYSQMQLVKGK